MDVIEQNHMPKTLIRIILLDDHSIVLDGLSSMFQTISDIECLKAFTNVEECLSYLDTNQVDVVILDIDMPAMSGIEVCRRIKEKGQNTKVIALTMLNQQSVIMRMMSVGADGYLLKNSGSTELTYAITEVVKGQNYYSKAIRDVMESIANKSKQDGFIPKLSSREKEVAKLILEELTVNQIAKQLFLSPETVSSHKKNMMKKLGVNKSVGLIKILIEHKLLD